MRRRAFLFPSLVVLLLAIAAPGPAGADDDAGLLPDLPGLSMSVGQAPASQTAPASTPSPTPSPETTPDPTPRPTAEAPEPPSPGDSVPDLDLPAASEPEEAVASTNLQSVTRIHYVLGSEPSPDPDGSCPDATTCEIHEVGRARWPTDGSGQVVVDYRYNDTGRPSARAPSEGAVRSLIRFSGREWTRWNPNVVFRDVGTTSAGFGDPGPDGGCADGVNSIGWAPLGGGAIGAAKICFDPQTMAIRDVDMALNSRVRWENLTSDSVASRAFDLRAVATHEFGHYLSLFDLRSPEASSQTMYASSGAGETHKRTLARGDVIGSMVAYPCGPEDRCSLTGIVDD